MSEQDAVERSHQAPIQTAGPAYFVGRGAIRQHGKSRRAACDVAAGRTQSGVDMEHALGVRLLDQR